MKYKQNKLRLNEMQGFYCLVNLGLVLIFILNVYRKKSSSILLRTNMFNSRLFEKHVPSQVLKYFSVENLETTSSTFLLKSSSMVYFSWVNNYWGSILTLYLRWGAFSLVCVLSSFFFFLFVSVFSLADTNNS